MQDLSCVGQCSLTVALPILSAYGVETCVLPTAVLSNHTMFAGWSYLDLTAETANIYGFWEKNGFKFDAFYSGYLGKKELTAAAEECIDKFLPKGAKVVVDPCLGDNGKLYPAFDLSYVQEVKKLAKRADVVLPNLTEACALTDTEYKAEYDKDFCKELCRKTHKTTGAIVVMTGVVLGDKIGEIIYNGKTFEEVFGEYIPKSIHGTGDIFASVFTAGYVAGKTLKECCEEGGKFVLDCIKATPADHTYGVCFEQVLAKNRK